MRKLAIAVALSSTLLATPAFARDGAWYVGGEFGAMIVEDTDVDIGAVDNAIKLNHEYGYDGGLFVGYDLGAFRIEAEAAYKHADLESFDTTIRLPGEGVLFPAQRTFAGGSSSALSFMINGMLDFGDDEGISGFVGGGVGMARVKANNQRVFANTAPFLDGSDSKLAWQVFAGVRQAISDNIDVTVKYRFFNVDNIHLTAFNGGEAEYRFRSHSLLGGITFNFPTKGPRCADGSKPVNGSCCPPGTVELAPGVCCPKGQTADTLGQCCPPSQQAGGRCCPPDQRVENGICCPEGQTPDTAGQCCPPTQQAGGRCCPPGTSPNGEGKCCPGPECIDIKGPFIVFFDWERWERHELSPEALRVLDDAAAQYDRTGSVKVSIEAHTDTSGSYDFNDDLSKKRLATVQSYLAERGVPPVNAEIVARGYGERCPFVDSGNGVREPQNRRVEIYYGPREQGPEGSCPPPQN